MDGNTIPIQMPVSVESAKGTPNMLFPIGSSATIIPLSWKIISLKDWLSCHFFRDQASNPFNSKSFFDTYCKCLLSYGDIVGHHTKVKCGYCVRNKYPFFCQYYLNRVTVLPRLSNQTIPLTVETKRQRDSEDNLNHFDITAATTDRSRTTANIDKTSKLLAWKDVCDLQNKYESLDLIGSHWDMVEKLLLVMTNPMIKPRLSNQRILYNNTATATATPFSNINNYSLMMTDGTDSPRGGAESNIRSGLRRTGAIHRPEKTLQRSEEGEKNYIARGVEFFNLYKKIL
ncbi:hypothetical protein BY996DRAFT_6409093 [Phakopsora pachyrhizi]|nr:hypothetical protein BY996DRAFT_6409093 [Phakopsora pachyrhizi]